MGSYISVGLVGTKNNACQTQKYCEIYKNYKCYMQDLIISFPMDKDFNDWKTVQINDNNIKEYLDLCLCGEIALLKLNLPLFKLNLHFSNKGRIDNVLIKLKSDDNYDGILIEIPEESIYDKVDMYCAEKIIIEEMAKALQLGFDYAFCDHEVDLEFVNDLENPYSILLTKANDKFTLRLNGCHIDGLTKRTFAVLTF